jgi:DNA polymerase-1
MDGYSNREIWAIDTEWGFRNGAVDHESSWEPVVLCAQGLRSGRKHQFWAKDGRLLSFFREHAKDLFVAHYAVAEMKYLLRLGIPVPERWFDTFVAYRLLTNKPNNLEAKLTTALRERRLPHLAPREKEELRQRILHLRFDPHCSKDRTEIVDYCYSDAAAAAALFGCVHGEVKPATMAHWVEFLKAVARMELCGIPFDLPTHESIIQKRGRICTGLQDDINKTWTVFVNGSFSRHDFFEWCRVQQISWPIRMSKTTGRRYRSLDNDTMKKMEGRHPFIADVRQASKTLNKLSRRSLVVDPVSKRHYFSTNPFRSVTGRNQPKNFVFSGPKWMRFLILPESPDHVLVYIDYSAQEIGIAAALSGDRNMRDAYAADDCHMDFAIRAGAAPKGATKHNHGKIRSQYKAVNLGVQYGQTAYGIADSLGIGHREAEALVAAHRVTFPTFWDWIENMVQGSIDRGYIVTPCGWRSIVPPGHNERTWFNWPMQAAGADIMRLTITYLDRQDVRILAPVHDGFLLSCHRSQVEELRAAVDYACTTAVEHVLPGFRLKWDFTVHDGRFQDEDGRPLWNKLQAITAEIGNA